MIPIGETLSKTKKRSATMVVERFFVFRIWSMGLTKQIIIQRRRLFFRPVSASRDWFRSIDQLHS